MTTILKTTIHFWSFIILNSNIARLCQNFHLTDFCVRH